MQDLQTTLSALSDLLLDGQADMETQSVLSDISYQYEDYGDNIRISAVRAPFQYGPEWCTGDGMGERGTAGLTPDAPTPTDRAPHPACPPQVRSPALRRLEAHHRQVPRAGRCRPPRRD